MVCGAPPGLSFEDVSKTYADGCGEIVVFDRVSFEVQGGTFVGVIGERRSGKSTLLRLAAGIEMPSSGVVRLGDRDLADMSVLERERLWRRTVVLLSLQDWWPNPNETVAEYVALSLGSYGPGLREARRRARQSLARVGMTSHADEAASRLSLSERARVLLARALVREPAVLLVDEPAVIPNLRERADFCEVLRSIASERGMTLVIASEETATLHGVAVLMSIGDGELCSTADGGSVVPLRRRRPAQGG